MSSSNIEEIRRFEISPILDDIKINDKIPIEITCIDVHNDDIYLGTEDSFILFYPAIINKNQKNKDYDKSIQPIYKYLGLKKPITQLKVLSALDRFIYICDNTFTLCNLSNLETINSFKQIRNIYSCCLNQNPVSMDPFSVECCLAKRKSLTIALIYSDKMTITKEINVAEQPLVLSMDGYYVCMASQSKYYMINWQNNSNQLLCEHGDDPYSYQICKYISRNEFLINGPSYLGVFVKTSGISERPPIDLGPNVFHIAYSYPYILCLKSHSISIISLIDSKIKDEFLVENGVYLDNFDGKIIAATKDRVLLLHRTSWEEQIDSLLLNEKSQEAVDLFHHLCESGMLAKNSIDYAYSIHVRAGLIELKKKNLEMAKKFLIETDFEIDKLFNLNLNLTETLKIKYEERDKDIKVLIENIKTSLEPSLINKFLLDYIEEYENQFETPIDIKLVKTAKLLIYLENITEHLESIKLFFKNENNYNFQLIENHLQQQNLYYLLALFYSFRNNKEKAIELLKKLEKNILQDDYYPGISELCQLLIDCQNAQLILNHIEFILEKNLNQGAQVLIANTKLDREQNKFPILNPDFVITMLHKYREALVIYLEHLIFVMKIQTTQVHTTLMIIYIEILSLQKENEEQDSKLSEEIKLKLKRLLEESDYYDKRSVLKNLLNHRLDYEAATLYGKLGEHGKAFEIYLSDDHLDYDQALKHCIYYGMKDDDQIYRTLLTIYLDLFRKNGPEVMKPLLEFLNHSKCHFDLKTTLNELPEDWPLILIKRHLSNHINWMFDSKFQTSFGRCLALSSLERYKKEKHQLNNQPIRIDSDSTKLLESKFVWLPSTKMICHDFCYYGTNMMMTNSNNSN